MRTLEAEIGPPLDAEALRALFPRPPQTSHAEDPSVERARCNLGVVTVRRVGGASARGVSTWGWSRFVVWEVLARGVYTPGRGSASAAGFG
jgi:hypothetical protein